MIKYMFSESAGLLCSIESFGVYRVLNGGWRGIRDGDQFKVERGSETHTVLTIKDWEEVDPNTWTEDKQEEWYFR